MVLSRADMDDRRWTTTNARTMRDPSMKKCTKAVYMYNDILSGRLDELRPGHSAGIRKKVVSKRNVRVSSLASVAWMPNGRWVYTAGANGEIVTWDGTNFSFVVTTNLVGELHTVRSLRVIRTNEHYPLTLVGDVDGDLTYWSDKMLCVATHKPFGEDVMEPISNISINPTGLHVCIVGGARNEPCVWDLHRGVETTRLVGHTHVPHTCDWHHTSRAILSAGRDRKILISDPRGAAKTALVSLRLPHNNTITVAKWSPHSDDVFVTACRSGVVAVWDVRTLGRGPVGEDHADGRVTTSGAWCPHDPFAFFTGTASGAVEIWNATYIDEMQQGIIPDAHRDAIWDMAWSPVGEVLVTVSKDSFMNVWGRTDGDDTYLDASFTSPPKLGVTARSRPVVYLRDHMSGHSYRR